MSGAVLVLGLLVAAAVVVRLIPRFIVPHGLGSDTYGHLSLARAIRENGMRPPALQPRSIIEQPNTYPFLYHWLLALLPARGAELAERISSALFDALLVVAAFAAAWTGATALGLPQAEAFAAWTAFLVAFSPALLRVSSGPRAYRGTARTLGQLLFGVYAGALAVHQVHPHPGLLAAAAFSVALLSIASKFGNQTVVFSAALVACGGYVEPALTAAAGYALALVLTFGRAWRVWRGQVRHSIYYYRHLQEGYVQPENPGLIAHLRSAPRTPRAFAHWVLTARHPLHLLLVAFWSLPAALVLLALRPELLQGSEGALLRFTLAMSLAGLVLMFLIKLKPLLFLGESERYLEFMAVPQALFVAQVALALGRPELLYACAIYAALITPLFLYLATRSFRRDAPVYDDLLPLLPAIDRPEARVYSLGTYWWPLLYGTTRAQLLLPTSNVDLTRPDTLERLQAAYGNYPFPGIPLPQVIAMFEIDHLVTHDDALSAYAERVDGPALAGLEAEELAERNGFRVYAVRVEPTSG